ncbi:hypothetical protein [Alteribacillus iranensis]|uniref:Uncharacterized protein n=1 Tax=Alteribacillus iranensis TaxID=930128 RepID=A0A1I1ZJ34_9BACI|nr:hypothetical protein [Alteribacillus iranensis]SFE31709.1 hypothetical protein SAMN05192532_101272 [Alteribacillus iranensis]
MDKLYNQVQIYLNMDEEIDFKEFQAYYQQVLKYLDEYSSDLHEDDLWKALFVVESIMSNAENRAKTAKKAEAKKYNKMATRTKLYAQNFTKRLSDLGYDEEQIGSKFEEMLEEGPEEK